MQCVILAGGLGTRMRPLTAYVPKTLLPVLGRPFAGHQLQWLTGQGVTSVVYCIGFLGDQVRAFAGDGSRWGLKISYVDEGPRLMGTGGAVRLALDAGVLESAFLVLYGDSYLSADVLPVWQASEGGRLPVMAVLRNDGRWDASNAIFCDGRVLRYEKGRADAGSIGMHYIDYGLSVLPRAIIAETVPSDRAYDLAVLYSELSRRGLLRGVEVHRRFYEIGSPAGLRELEEHLQSVADPVEWD